MTKDELEKLEIWNLWAQGVYFIQEHNRRENLDATSAMVGRICLP